MTEKDKTSLKSQKETQQTNQKPEPKYALEEKYKKQKKLLPQPTGWRIIVLPFKMNDRTKGGVLMTESTLERQQIGSQCGLVLAMGSQCYNDKERYPEGPWCKINDWVVFARYAGSRIQIEGGEIRLLNDDEILATVKDPTDILHAF
jgi:co-chaperonin GroES (HSP10)